MPFPWKLMLRAVGNRLDDGDGDLRLCSSLLIFGLYRSTIEGLLDRILTGRYTFIAFLVSLGLVPLFLVVLGWGLG